MDEYVGKICPYCKTEIKEGEEVKVCPECGIPHHAACWEENKGSIVEMSFFTAAIPASSLHSSECSSISYSDFSSSNSSVSSAI